MISTKCACGQCHATEAELRQHIALQTPRWPAQRCTASHYDPRHLADIAYLKSRAPYPGCRHPAECVAKGYCTRDPNCGE